jgi:hypothetical protein
VSLFFIDTESHAHVKRSNSIDFGSNATVHISFGTYKLHTSSRGPYGAH